MEGMKEKEGKEGRQTSKQASKERNRQIDKHEKTRQNADPTEAPNAGRVGKIEN